MQCFNRNFVLTPSPVRRGAAGIGWRGCFPVVLFLLTSLFLLSTAQAVDPDPTSDGNRTKGEQPGPWRRRHPEWNGGGARRRQQMLQRIMERIKQVDPQQYERLKKMQSTDPDAFRGELRRLLRRGRFRHGDGQQGGRSSDRNAFWGRKMPGFGKLPGAQFMRQLSQDDPEKFKEMRQLYEKDPEEFHQRLRDMIRQRYGQKAEKGRNRELEQSIRKLIKQYSQAGNEAEKQAVRLELKKKLNQAFDERVKARKARMAQLEKQLDKFRKIIAKRQQNRDKIIEKRLDSMLQHPTLH